jgi:hypothetical protein
VIGPGTVANDAEIRKAAKYISLTNRLCTGLCQWQLKLLVR